MGRSSEASGAGPVLHRPAIALPDYVCTLAEVQSDIARRYAGHPQLPLILHLIEKADVRTRHFVQPVEETLDNPGPIQRATWHNTHARRLLPRAIEQALANAGCIPADIHLLVYVSASDPGMPSATAWLINELGFPATTTQLPITRLGCVAGAAAINRARDYCLAHPGSNALIVSCELTSLAFQPDDVDVDTLLAHGLFADATAAAVIRADGEGIRLLRSASYFAPGTEDWISYRPGNHGPHLHLDKRVPETVSVLAPRLRDLAAAHGWGAGELDFYAIHAGGPRILGNIQEELGIAKAQLQHSWNTLARHGNTVSATLFDTLDGMWSDARDHGGNGLVLGIGPGITAEATLAAWTVPDVAPSSESIGASTRPLA